MVYGENGISYMVFDPTTTKTVATLSRFDDKEELNKNNDTLYGFNYGQCMQIQSQKRVSLFGGYIVRGWNSGPIDTID